jgi:uncharacterized membrane protein
VKRRNDLTEPRQRGIDLSVDPEAFGRFAEGIARYFGTARFIVFQTVFVAIWILLNVAVVTLQWDPYPFILLNLAFSTQAAYAAPLILLAQSRQEQRDKAQTQLDRDVAERTQNDTEFLAREIASVRIAIADSVTNEELGDHVDDLTKAIERLTERVEALTVTDDA